MALPESLIDKRIVRRALATGQVDAAEYRQLLEDLPDLTDQVWTPEDTSTGVDRSQE